MLIMCQAERSQRLWQSSLSNASVWGTQSTTLRDPSSTADTPQDDEHLNCYTPEPKPLHGLILTTIQRGFKYYLRANHNLELRAEAGDGKLWKWPLGEIGLHDPTPKRQIINQWDNDLECLNVCIWGWGELPLNHRHCHSFCHSLRETIALLAPQVAVPLHPTQQVSELLGGQGVISIFVGSAGDMGSCHQPIRGQDPLPGGQLACTTLTTTTCLTAAHNLFCGAAKAAVCPHFIKSDIQEFPSNSPCLNTTAFGNYDLINEPWISYNEEELRTSYNQEEPQISSQKPPPKIFHPFSNVYIYSWCY